MVRGILGVFAVLAGATLLSTFASPDRSGRLDPTRPASSVTGSSHLAVAPVPLSAAQPEQSQPAAPIGGERRLVTADPSPLDGPPDAAEPWVAALSEDLPDSRVGELRVTCMEDGQPVVGATVDFHHRGQDHQLEDPPGALLTGTTDHHGILLYRFRPRPDALEVRVRAPGRASGQRCFWPPGRPFHEVKLYQGRALQVQVTEPDNTPHQGAQLELLGLDSIPAALAQSYIVRRERPPRILEWQEWTDGRGRSTFAGIPCGIPFVVRVLLESGAEFQTRPLSLSTGSLPHELEFVLPHRGELRGRVVHDGDRDLEYLWVMLTPRARTWQYSGTADFTDPDGSFRFTDVPFGEYDLVVESDHLAEARRVVSVPAPSTPPLEIDVGDVWRFEGQVFVVGAPRSRDQATWPDELLLRSPNTGEWIEVDVDDHGECLAEDLTEPWYHLELAPWDDAVFRLHSPLRVTSTRPPETVLLEPGSVVIEGRPGSRPEDDDELEVRILRDGQSVWTRADIDEPFQSEPLVPGRFLVLVQSSESAVLELGPYTLRAGESLDLGTLDVPRAPELQARVLDRHGQPLASVEVDHEYAIAGTDEFTIKNWTESGPDGVFRLAAARGGFLVFSHPDHAPLVVSRDRVTEGSTLTMRVGATIRGRVLAAGAGLPGLPLELSRRDSWADLLWDLDVATDPNGCFQIPHVAPGEYELEIDGGAHGAMATIPVRVGETDQYLAPVLLED